MTFCSMVLFSLLPNIVVLLCVCPDKMIGINTFTRETERLETESSVIPLLSGTFGNSSNLPDKQMKGTLIPLLMLFSSAYADPCPSGYTQAPNDGDCYQIKHFYDSFIGQPVATTYSDAEIACNEAGGGILASIHSQEENEFIRQLSSQDPHCGPPTNIGLRCTGKVCRWDDGSPLSYKNFNGAGPTDDGKTRCFGLMLNATWSEQSDTFNNYQSCGKYPSACWACSVKAAKIECTASETPYKGGCVSVHTDPLDQRTAEASCPGGGHLVSIHGQSDNGLFTSLAMDAGLNGTIYIGGKSSSGADYVDWSDQSYYNTNFWANGFPNVLFGWCVQILLNRQVAHLWTNVDCTVKQPYICFRNGGVYGPTPPEVPKADAHCSPIQYFSGNGTVYSPNYPVSIPTQQTCQYVLESKEGTSARVKFPNFNCRSGTSVSLYDGLDNVQSFITFTTYAPPPDQWYTATSNVIKIIFSVNETASPEGTGWEAEFTGISIE